MIKLRKNFLAASLVALLAVGGAACGGDEGTGDTGETTTEGAETMTEEAGTMTEGAGTMTEDMMTES